LRENWVSYEFENANLEKLQQLYSESNGRGEQVWYKTNAYFDDVDIPLKSEKKTVNYTTDNLKTGTMDIDYFNSASQKQSMIAVNNIKPTDDSLANVLEVGDILKVASTNFKHILR